MNAPWPPFAFPFCCRLQTLRRFLDFGAAHLCASWSDLCRYVLALGLLCGQSCRLQAVLSNILLIVGHCRSFHCHFGWIVLHRKARPQQTPAWPRDRRFPCVPLGQCKLIFRVEWELWIDCKQGTISLSTRSRTRHLPQREQRSSWLVLMRTMGSCKMVWGYSEEAVKTIGLFVRTFGYAIRVLLHVAVQY